MTRYVSAELQPRVEVQQHGLRRWTGHALSRIYARIATRRTIQRVTLLAFVIPSVAYIAVFFGYPVYQDIAISFENYGFGAIAVGHGTFVGLANYRSMLTNGVTGLSAVNTVAFTALSVSLQFVIGFAMAIYLNMGFRFADTLRRLVLIPWVLPSVVTATMFSLMFATTNGMVNELLKTVGLVGSNVDWLDTRLLAMTVIILANVWAGVPFNAVLLYSGLQDVPREQMEAAAMDGANAWQRFRSVTVPAMRPVIMTVVLLGVVYTIKVFDLVYVLTGGGPANESQVMSTWAYTQAMGDFQFGTGTAVANILFLFSLTIGAIYLWISRVERRVAR
jgi:multiple sugar transport system permease protein